MTKGTEIFEVNGLKVVNIHHDSKLVYIGINMWIGSIFEKPEVEGISHFCEHLAFKQTTSRNWNDINVEMAKMGANYNARTGKSDVMYYLTVPMQNTEKAIDVMADMVFNSTFPEDEIEKERGVIVEEKKMYLDDPISDFYTRIYDNFFIKSKGHTGIGSFDTIKNIHRKDILEYLDSRCNKSNIMLVVCGNIKSSALRRMLKSRIDPKHRYLRDGERNTAEKELWSNKSPLLVMERENIQQSHVALLGSGVDIFDKDRTSFQVFTQALGGGMFSYLFTRIREELGLCYSVGAGSDTLSYPNDVVFMVTGSMMPKNVEIFRLECDKLFNQICKDGIKKDIFECAKADRLASLLRTSETTSGKANCVLNRYFFNRKDTLDDLVRETEKVTIKTCNRVAERVLQNKLFNVSIMNPVK